ncbi:MAG TPA: hypothetical protein VFY01_00490, partial [Rheinheimera sp.]|nr:hypothetical protein [Rheinheimera sp.]
MTWQDHSVHCAFFQPYAEQEQFNNRLVLLLQQLLAKLKAQTGQHAVAAKDIVYLILPEFSGPDNPQLNTLLQQLMRSCPGLLQSEQCRVFPYGSAGALMALNAAQQALQQQPATPIWLLGVDSLCNAGAFADYKAADASYVLSEGAIALCITAADCGLSLLFSGADALACQSDQGEDSAAGALFRQVAQR